MEKFIREYPLHFQMAVKEANKSDMDDKHGAVAFLPNGRIISFGFNHMLKPPLILQP